MEELCLGERPFWCTGVDPPCPSASLFPRRSTFALFLASSARSPGHRSTAPVSAACSASLAAAVVARWHRSAVSLVEVVVLLGLPRGVEAAASVGFLLASTVGYLLL